MEAANGSVGRACATALLEMNEMERLHSILYSYGGAVAIGSSANYNYLTALFEFVDNSFGAAATEVQVRIFSDKNNFVKKVQVWDNGHGLPEEQVGVAFSPGGKKGSGLNEHGIGMKAAIDWFGHLTLFASKTLDSEAYEITELDPDENEQQVGCSTDDEWAGGPQGTVIEVECTSQDSIVRNYASSALYSDLTKFGRRYADLLTNGRSLELKWFVESEEFGSFDGFKLLKTCDVEPYYADYESIHVVGETLKGTHHDWEVVLEIGTLKDSIPKHDPIRRVNGGGGLDLVLHGRVVETRSKKPLASIGIDFSHPSYNSLFGRVKVLRGIKTTPKKDGVQENDGAFSELRDAIKQVWKERGLSSHWEATRGGVTEKEIEENLVEYLKESGYEDVGSQKSTIFGTKMDVVAKRDGSDFVFEIKKNQAKPNDVLQLVGYMMATGRPKGVLVAMGFSKNAIDHADSWDDFDIEMWDLTSMAYRGLAIR